jgi:hypothetical protein
LRWKFLTVAAHYRTYLQVGDQLRELLVNEYSENAGVFTSAEKNEFIFRIFKLLCVGGNMCQPDDKLQRSSWMTTILI